MGFKNILWQGSGIKQDSSNRLVTDNEKTIWNGKCDVAHAHDYIVTIGMKACESEKDPLQKAGISYQIAYNNGYPENYGNVLNLNGLGQNQIMVSWPGNNTDTQPNMYFRGKTDNDADNWTTWLKVLNSNNFSEYAATKDHTHNYIPLSGTSNLEGSIFPKKSNSCDLGSSSCHFRTIVSDTICASNSNTTASNTANISIYGNPMSEYTGKCAIRFGDMSLNQKSIIVVPPDQGSLSGNIPVKSEVYEKQDDLFLNYGEISISGSNQTAKYTPKDLYCSNAYTIKASSNITIIGCNSSASTPNTITMNATNTTYNMPISINTTTDLIDRDANIFSASVYKDSYTSDYKNYGIAINTFSNGSVNGAAFSFLESKSQDMTDTGRFMISFIDYTSGTGADTSNDYVLILSQTLAIQRSILDKSGFTGFSLLSYANNRGELIPAGAYQDNISLGSEYHKWKYIYATNGTIQTSNELKKNIIENGIDTRYENLYTRLEPIAFTWNNETADGSNHDRIHLGLGAQTTKKHMDEVGITADEYALYCEDTITDEDGNETSEKEYGINYGQLHALHIHMIQKLLAKVNELETRLMEFENK